MRGLFSLRKKAKPSRVVILGCGPAGIFAAHAAAEMGFPIEIYSLRRRSQMYGSQYLHSPIPGLTKEAGRKVRHILIGRPEDYAPKVYGDEAREEPAHSWLTTDEQAWDIRQTYNDGFRRYLDRIQQMDGINAKDFTNNYAQPHLAIHDAFVDPKALIVSTIPATSTCNNLSHRFQGRAVQAVGEAPEAGVFLDDYSIEKETVTHNSEKSPSWYRAAHIFDHKTIEWPLTVRPFHPDIVTITKVLGTDCDCFTDSIMKVGRQGAWDRNYLTHHVYQNVKLALEILS